MKCPHCDFKFGALAANVAVLPEIAPLVCEMCAGVALLLDGKEVRKPTGEELDALKQSPAWASLIGPAIAVIQRFHQARKAALN